MQINDMNSVEAQKLINKIPRDAQFSREICIILHQTLTQDLLTRFGFSLRFCDSARGHFHTAGMSRSCEPGAKREAP